MQGRQDFQRVLFDTVDLESLIPDDHLLRGIDARIDFGFIHDVTKDLYCADNGRNSIDPVLFFRMQLISYLYGMKSDRELCREVHLNLAYRWFCRLSLHDAVPDHSSMTRIRDRLGEATFREIFEQLIARWGDQGHIRGRRIVADASLVEADAAVGSLVERDDAESNARSLRNHERRYHDFKTGERRRKYANQTHVSASDPDASLVSRRGGYKKLSHKAHFSADADSRMITDCHATTGARHECPILPQRIQSRCSRSTHRRGDRRSGLRARADLCATARAENPSLHSLARSQYRPRQIDAERLCLPTAQRPLSLS